MQKQQQPPQQQRSDHSEIELTEEEKNKAIDDFKKAKFVAIQAAQAEIERRRQLYSQVREQALTEAQMRFKFKHAPHKDNREPIFETLCHYFAQDEQWCREHGISLDKGILLWGPIGCGKTALMRLFQNVNPTRYFRIVECTTVAADYESDGTSGMKEYSHYRPGLRSNSILFDDMGIENMQPVHYGTKLNTMEHIIMSRYASMKDENKGDNRFKGYQMHITTNISAEMISTHYGARVASRLKEMVNVLTFPTDAKDLRG